MMQIAKLLISRSFPMKLIKTLNSNFKEAVLLDNNLLLTIEDIEKKTDEGELKTIHQAQVWNLDPEKAKLCRLQSGNIV
jgi:hypothetical protein